MLLKLFLSEFLDSEKKELKIILRRDSKTWVDEAFSRFFTKTWFQNMHGLSCIKLTPNFARCWWWPIPDSKRICAEFTAPADNTTSFLAITLCAVPSLMYSTPTALLPSNRIWRQKCNGFELNSWMTKKQLTTVGRGVAVTGWQTCPWWGCTQANNQRSCSRIKERRQQLLNFLNPGCLLPWTHGPWSADAHCPCQ